MPGTQAFKQLGRHSCNSPTNVPTYIDAEAWDCKLQLYNKAPDSVTCFAPPTGQGKHSIVLL